MTDKQYSDDMLVYADFQKKHQVHNPLEVWRKGLINESDKTLLTYRSLLGVLDRALLEHKLEPEKVIIEKYFNQMKVMFCE